jgi:Mg-chelatase subunit ChlD
MGVQRHKHTRDRDTGIVDTETKLADLATGSNLDKAFYTVTHAKRLNAAVQVLVDISGSMNDGHKISTAIKFSLLICGCLERLRVPVELIAFDNSAELVKSWTDKFSVSRKVIAGLCGGGGTNLPSAMASALASLGPRRESKHIQLILTDGDIGSADRCRGIAKRDHKLRTYAFGVGVAIPSGVFYKTVSYLKTDNMVDTIIDQLRTAMLPDR